MTLNEIIEELRRCAVDARCAEGEGDTRTGVCRLADAMEETANALGRVGNELERIGDRLQDAQIERGRS